MFPTTSLPPWTRARAAWGCPAASTCAASCPRPRWGPDRRRVQRSGRPGCDVAGLALTTWLIDKSALVRLAASPDAQQWAARIERGVVRITTVTRLEVGYSARSAPALRAGLRQPPLAAMPVEYLTPAIEDRAVEVLTLLADRGQHRAPSIPDLVIAATAELAGLTVLHQDKDFEIIAGITGQPLERLNVEAGAEMDSGAG